MKMIRKNCDSDQTGRNKPKNTMGKYKGKSNMKIESVNMRLWQTKRETNTT